MPALNLQLPQANRKLENINQHSPETLSSRVGFAFTARKIQIFLSEEEIYEKIKNLL
jgi:hypothetical protein